MEPTDAAEPDPLLRPGAAPEPDEALPVLDPAPLKSLVDVAGDGAAQRFLAEYLDLLPSRVSMVIGGLSSRDMKASMEAVVTLKVSSAMAGAVRMEHYCRELEDSLAAREVPDAAKVLMGMSRTSRLTLQDVHRAGMKPG